MNREYDHIKDYIERNLDNEIRLLISDFAILWNNYEHYLYNEFYSPSKIKEKILSRNIFDDKSNINYINEIFNKLKKYFEYRNISFNVNSIKDNYHIRPNDIRDEKLNDIMISNDVKDKLYFILLIVGRVRNNMFHGIKIISDLSYQKELFEISNEILTFILDNSNIDMLRI